MLFYEACVSGELTFQTLGESPLADKMPPKMKNSILEATLKNDKLVLMGTDCVPQPGLIKGNSVSLNLHCSSEDEIKFFYEKLHAVGTATYPFQDTFWSALFGGLTDKFGNRWLLNFNKNQHTNF